MAELQLEDAFSRLLGRQPTDTERQRLYTVRDALGLRNNDALWLVLIALEHYQGLFEQIPADIEKARVAAVGEVSTAATRAAEVAAKTAGEDVKKELSRAVQKAAAEVSRGATRKQLVQWTLLTAVVLLAVVGGVGAWAYSAGSSSALAQARARSAWAESAEGRLAFELAKLGSLKVVARCEAPGWEIDGGKCYPEPLEGHRVFGWAIPRLSRENDSVSARSTGSAPGVANR